MENVLKIIKEYTKNDKTKELIRYFVAGGVTTLVNVFIYRICAYNLGVDYLISTIIAWIAAVLFAFVSNKLFVFRQTNNLLHIVIREFFSFIIARLATGTLDIAIMWLGVSVINFNDMLVKFISNIIVIILNYILGKFLVFSEKTH